MPLLLRRDDLHLKRFRRPQETTTVFVVDASGSQAMSRLAEAKGAVELLLADCYVRRDRVALLAFRNAGAELLLSPTRSLARARRALSSLPGGGGTPLAAGIEAAWLLGRHVQTRDGGRVVLVFLTDARANITRDGHAGRLQAGQDALTAARRLRADGLQSLLIDTSSRPEPAALVLAQAMGARYVPLPHGEAAQVYAAVSAAVSAPAAV
ncbi:VWA domain-containing protein [Roseateles sp. SL47]|uniref:VWA domain-containing protein n=1 Tax=Roseateles sp. SL47 TaxID=2995138 RepID=UPI00226F3EF3|nr:VWA domain-containing protein [Roseateles sp. SL47]WAC73204.1 VWA domain-containing protein [Roseateles sp. SL47]